MISVRSWKFRVRVRPERAQVKVWPPPQTAARPFELHLTCQRPTPVRHLDGRLNHRRLALLQSRRESAAWRHLRHGGPQKRVSPPNQADQTGLSAFREDSHPASTARWLERCVIVREDRSSLRWGSPALTAALCAQPTFVETMARCSYFRGQSCVVIRLLFCVFEGRFLYAHLICSLFVCKSR